MATLRKLLLLVVATLFVLVAAVFAYGNREPISVDIGFMRVEEVSVALAFAVAFAIGAVFGALCAGLALLKMAREKRILRRELRSAEAELRSLRSLPLHDAN